VIIYSIKIKKYLIEIAKNQGNLGNVDDQKKQNKMEFNKSKLFFLLINFLCFIFEIFSIDNSLLFHD